jgi:predicted NBD/HSP70 family sugar kinase
VTSGRDEIGQRSETVRRANLSAIVRALHEAGPLTRSELVARTGLTRSAIRDLVGELAAAGLAAEDSPAHLGTPGRPSPVVRLEPAAGVVLALEISVDSLAAALVGLGGAVFGRERVDRPRGHLSVEDVVADLVRLADTVRARCPEAEPVLAIGCAIVGVVRRADGLVSMAPNLGWREVPLGRRLAAAFGSEVPIVVANEADLGVLAEHRRGAAVGVDDVIYLSGEVGVGGGLIVAGQPLTGVAGFAGEVGHLALDPDGLPCRCGSVGCWETLVGEKALLRLAGRPERSGRAAVEAVLAEAGEGSAAARAALTEVGRWLGIGLAGLVNIFNPRLVVLGGIFGRIHPFIEATVAGEMERRTLAGPRPMVEVVPAGLGVDAPLLGAAELALEPLLADPTSRAISRDAPAERVSA